MYKNGMTKSKFKKSMRFFWTKKWTYEKSPQDWVNIINAKEIWTIGNSEYAKTINASSTKKILVMAVDKLVLEKKCTKEEGENLKTMIGSPDQENQFLALTVMATLKPKQFLKT
jgi:hypothetical protein